YVIVRPGSIYGPGGKGWTIYPVQQIKEGNLVVSADDGKITPGYIDNFVDGMWLCINSENAVGKIFNLCDGDVMKYSDFYMSYAKMLGKESLPTLAPWKTFIAKSKISSLLRTLLGRTKIGPWSNHFRFNPSQYSISNARKLLGYNPRISYDEGMKLTEKWLKANNYIRNAGNTLK